MDRRNFIKSVAGLTAAAVATRGSSLRAQDTPIKPVRIGIVGVGARGRGHLMNLLNYQKEVTITAVCDLHEDRVQSAIEIVEKIKGNRPAGYFNGTEDYRNMLERGDVDGVLVATGTFALGPISIDCLKAGKHVGFEVPGMRTLEECHKLVEAKEEGGKRAMLLENCSYEEPNMMIYNMIRNGIFGEPYSGVGSYIHDCRPICFEPDGSLTWRGRLMRDDYGCIYNSHALGSVSKWLGINDGDRMESCSCTMSRPREMHQYAVAKFGADSEAAKVDFKMGDSSTTMITTAKGKMIQIDNSISNSRPYARYYSIQGTKGCYDSRKGLYLLNGKTTAFHGYEEWGNLNDHQDKWRHPYWQKGAETARKEGGHGGIDWFVMFDFVKMVRNDAEPWIDVYDAAAWSAIKECSMLSLDRKGAPVEVPDFTGGKWKSTEWRKGRLNIDFI